MTEITKSQIEEAIASTWSKLEQAIQKDLDAVLSGEAELTASTTASVVKFLEASREMTRDPSLNQFDWSSLSLPTFDDD